MLAGYFKLADEPWPTLNRLLRMSRFARPRQKKRYRRLASATALMYGWKVPDPSEIDQFHTMLWLARVGPRVLDHDNLVGGAKCVVDGLCASPYRVRTKRGGWAVARHSDGSVFRMWGLFADDSPKYLTVHYKQMRTVDRRKYGTYIKFSLKRIKKAA